MLAMQKQKVKSLKNDMTSYFIKKQIAKVVYSVMSSTMEYFYLYFKDKERSSEGSGFPKDHTTLWNNRI